MSVASSFFDTNVVLYLLSADTAKADKAEALLAEGGVISVQVLNELANVGRRKLAMSWADIEEMSIQLRTVCRVEPLTVETHIRGIRIAERYNLSVYDSMVLASALDSECSVLYTEDLQDGQVIDGELTICNPFRT